VLYINGHLPAGREIDLLLESELDKPIILSFILSNDYRIRQISDNVLAMPAAMFISPFGFSG